MSRTLCGITAHSLLGLLTIVLGGSASAENWPGWRGPRGDGISAEATVPLEWSATRNVFWKTAIPGEGHSSPIIWDDSVFITAAVPAEKRRILLRLDRRTGAMIWQRTVLIAPLEPIHTLNSYASSTPATNGERVFCAFLDRDQMLVVAYDFDGNKLWECRPGPFASKHGFCTNPVLYRDKLFVNGDHDGDAFLALLRQEDGQVVWKTPRPRRTRSYCTPIVVRVDGRDQFQLNGSYSTAGYDAETGKQIWICDGPSEQMVATLVRNDQFVFSLGGFPERHLLAIRLGGHGDITRTHIAWRTHKSIPYVPSPLLYGDLLHVISDEGIYTCFNPPTGKVLGTRRANHHTSSSLVGACQRVYLTDDTGTTLVIANQGRWQKLAENKLEEDMFASPAISQGSIFLRGRENLFCIGPAEPATASNR